MKSLMLFVCLLLVLFSYSNAGSPDPYDVSYEMSGELFSGISDDSNDKLVSIKAYDSGNVLRAEKNCHLTMVCTINLAPLPAGSYNVKVFSQTDNISVPVYLN